MTAPGASALSTGDDVYGFALTFALFSPTVRVCFAGAFMSLRLCVPVSVKPPDQYQSPSIAWNHVLLFWTFSPVIHPSKVPIAPGARSPGDGFFVLGSFRAFAPFSPATRWFGPTLELRS